MASSGGGGMDVPSAKAHRHRNNNPTTRPAASRGAGAVVLQSFNLFIDSQRNNPLGGDVVDLPLHDLPFNAHPLKPEDHLIIKLKQANLARTWYKVNPNNNAFYLLGTQTVTTGGVSTYVRKAVRINAPVGDWPQTSSGIQDFAASTASKIEAALGSFVDIVDGAPATAGITVSAYYANSTAAAAPTSGSKYSRKLGFLFKETAANSSVGTLTKFNDFRFCFPANLGDAHVIFGGHRVDVGGETFDSGEAAPWWDIPGVRDGYHSNTFTEAGIKSLGLISYGFPMMQSEAYCYLTADAHMTSFCTDTYLSPNQTERPTSLISSRILGKIPIQDLYMSFDARSDEYELRLTYGALTHLRLAIVDSKGRQFPPISVTRDNPEDWEEGTTNFPTNTAADADSLQSATGGRGFEVSLRIDVVRHYGEDHPYAFADNTIHHTLPPSESSSAGPLLRHKRGLDYFGA